MPQPYYSISPSMLKQMDFCPAIPWMISKTGWIEPPTESMRSAKEETDASYKERIASSLGLEKPYRIEICLRDRETGLSGCIDIAAGSKRITIVEAKRYRRRRSQHFRTQLLAYAYLANKQIAPVERAILVMEERVELDIPITREHIETIEKKIARLKQILDREDPPPVNRTPRECTPCQYRRICPLAAT
ncbi:CRISPR-associated protein Cas4 [Desulfurococcaceae archaeon AG1]|nr:CRISPR-associated protein Cas4 [Desulfurococcaceae archaeon AG1]